MKSIKVSVISKAYLSPYPLQQQYGTAHPEHITEGFRDIKIAPAAHPFIHADLNFCYFNSPAYEIRQSIRLR